MRKTLVTLTLFLSACGAPAAETETSTGNESAGGENAAAYDPALTDCGGVWSGVGVQESGSWTVELTVQAPGGLGPCGTIEYPSLGCGGAVLDCVAQPDGSVTMREVYDHGLDRCAAAGSIRVTCGRLGTPNEAHMTWTWSGDGGPVTTELTRR